MIKKIEMTDTLYVQQRKLHHVMYCTVVGREMHKLATCEIEVALNSFPFSSS